MGVKGLWKLVLPIGRRISIESIEPNTILAIDASIWLIQFIKANRDPITGKVTAAAHIIGFFRRICRLLFHRLRPVFVFDGMAPEIKRLELIRRSKVRQEFTQVSDLTIQRTARKLIHETLVLQQRRQQQQQQDPPTAFVRGFNLGGGEKGGQFATSTSNTSTATTSSTEVVAVTEVKESSPQPLAENDLNGYCTEIEATKMTTTATTTSDWDIPLAVAAMEEANEMDRDEEDQGKNNDDENESDVEYEDFMPTSTTNRSNGTVTATVEDITKLPLIERKNAIESIQRQQRMQSRQEFIPAAHDMKQFSTVQMKHFLQSCHLNRSIRTTLEQEQHHSANTMDGNSIGGGGGGTIMASDNTTRVELIHETNNRNNGNNHFSMTTNKYHHSNNDTTTSNKYYDDTSKKKKKYDPTTKAIQSLFQQNRLTVIDDDTNCDQSNNNNQYQQQPQLTSKAISTSNIVMNIKAERSIQNKPMVDEWEDHDDQTEENDNNMMQLLQVNDEEQQVLWNDAVTKTIPVRRIASLTNAVQPTTTATATHDAASSIDSTTKHRRRRLSRRVIMDDDDDDHAKDHNRKLYKTSDTDPNNENDMIYGGMKDANEITATASININDLSTATTMEICNHIPYSALNHLQNDDDDDDVDDASGGGGFFITDHCTSTTGSVAKYNATAETVAANCGSRSHLDEKYRNISDHNNKDRGTTVLINVEDENFKDMNSGGDDDDVDWEEGDAITSNDAEKQDLKVNHVPADDYYEHIVARRNQLQKTAQSHDSLYIADEFVGTTSEPNSFKPQSATSKLQFSSETSDALMHAQETASRLSGWAGGALRRAILEANGGTATAATAINIDKKIEIEVSDEKDDESDDDRDEENQSAYVLRSNHFDYLDSQTTTEGTHVTTNEKTSRSPKQSNNISKLASKQTSRDNIITWNDVTVDTDLLEQNDAQWTAERNRRERDAETISDEMLMEVKQLLELFGIPYLVAPAEAESQCVALERLGMVGGIVTDDSDAFVFGGKVIYKNIFEEQKYTEVYNAVDAEQEMRLNQNSMVALAMLLGSDYTGGVKGVGIVNAMEILNTFDVSHDLKGGLTSFRNWLDGFDPPKLVDEDDPEKVKISKFHLKHMTARTRWIVPQNFPADNVIKAYIDPVVDKSSDRFSWGVPDIEKIILFCNKHIGWAPDDTKRFLEPVLQSLNRKKGLRQTRIDSYMRYEDGIKFADVKSKRLRDVLGLKNESTARDNKPSKQRSKED